MYQLFLLLSRDLIQVARREKLLQKLVFSNETDGVRSNNES